MRFKPKAMKVREIFGGDNTYEIPNFQRSFSWESKNYKEFIEDLLKSSNSCILKNSLKCDESSEYFFGTLIFVGDDINPDVKKPYVVVDGQQRLTTMTLFFYAILNHIEEIDLEYKTEYKEKCIFKKTIGGKEKEFVRLKNDNLEPILSVNINNINNKRVDGAMHVAKTNPQKWLIKSYEKIYSMTSKENIVKYVASDEKYNNIIEDENYVLFLDSLGESLLNSTVIAIFSEEDSSANILYRNFNSRGIPLSQTDLIKNELFSRLEDDSTSTISNWSEIESNMCAIDETIDTFFYHYMIGRYKNVTQKKIFEIFNREVEKSNISFIEFIQNLVLNSYYYKTIIKPTDDSEIFSVKNYFKKDSNQDIKRNLIFLKEIKLKQVRILLLTLFEAMENKIISPKDFRKSIEILALHQSIHVLSKSSSNKLTSIYNNKSRELFKAIQRKRKIMNFHQDLKKQLLLKIPDKSMVMQNENLKYDHKNKIDESKESIRKERALIKYILSTISVNKQDKDTQRGNNGLAFIYNSTIEHIIDQKSDNNNILRLGNLILLERDIHTNSGNKEKMYYNSRISVTKNFHKDYPEFSVDDIEKREMNLLNEYYEYVRNYK